MRYRMYGKRLSGVGVFGLICLLSLGWTDASAQIVINEFMASNSSSIMDSDGDNSDWIELYNPTTSTISLSGWSLTDDSADFTQWTFPNVQMAPGTFLMVFASGKDRRVAGAELHTNFSLSDSGEYLALVKSDGVTISHAYAPAYPSQLTDISYGLGHYSETLIAAGDPIKYYVPDAADAGVDWTATGYEDTGWTEGYTGIGFGAISPLMTVKTYKATGIVDSLAAAEALIANEASQAWVIEGTTEVVDYNDSVSPGHFTNDFRFPGLEAAPGDDYAVEITGNIIIPTAGAYTFGVASDDGFGFSMTRGARTYDFSFPTPRGMNDTLQTFSIAEAGSHAFRLVFYERGGGAGLELFAASGTFSSFTTNFHLVGDVATGGLQVIGGMGDSNLQPLMQGTNATVWTRMHFVVEDPLVFDELLMQMRYEDGFVAFINGVQVASANAPATLNWNSAALSNRPMEQSWDYVTFNLLDYLDALRMGPNVLAIQGLNDAFDDGEFFLLPEMTGADKETKFQYFTNATPGEMNVLGAIDQVGDTKFSVDRGFYSTAFDVDITCKTENSQIRYTLDGSEPTDQNGIDYTGPIRISKTTTLRAAAFRTGWLPSDTDTHTYLFIADVVTQSPSGQAPGPGWPTGSVNGQILNYGMDPDIVNNTTWGPQMDEALLQIPSISLTTNLENLFSPSTGIYVNPYNKGYAWERPTSMEILYPDGEQADLQINCGLRIRGGYSRSPSNPKHAFRMFFRSQYGDSWLEHPLFGDKGAERFKKIDLRTSQNYSWSFDNSNLNTMTRDIFSRDSQGDMGHPYTRGRKYHLYVNGHYWGIYETEERPEARYGQTYFGGEQEDYDVCKTESNAHYIEATDGFTDDYFQLHSLTLAGFETKEAYYRVLGLNPDGTRNPAYPVYVDPIPLIDYMLIIYYTGNYDSPISNFLGNTQCNNVFAIWNRTRADKGWVFLTHDSEHTMRFVAQAEDRTGPWDCYAQQYFNPQTLHQELIKNPEYRMLFADRVRLHLFENGALTPAVASARLRKRTDEISQAIIAESARWGDSKRSTPFTKNDWTAAINGIFNSWFPNRTTTVLNQFKGHSWYPNAVFPTLLINGVATRAAVVPKGAVLTMTHPNDADIYYTLNGREPSTGESIQTQYEDHVWIESNAAKRVFVPTAANGGSTLGLTWTATAFDDAAWTQGTGGVGYERSTTNDFDPYFDIDVEAEMYNKQTSCYIRIPFTLTADQVANTAELMLYAQCDDAMVVFLNGTRVANVNSTPNTLAWDSQANSAVAENNATLWSSYSLTDYTSSLQAGNNVIAIQLLNYGIGSSDLLGNLRLVSKVLIGGQTGPPLHPGATQYTAAITLNETADVFSRAYHLNEWSAYTPGLFLIESAPNDLIISEFLANAEGDDLNKEWIEVFNTTDEAINLHGWTIQDNDGDSHTIQAPDGLMVPARGYAVLGASTDTLLNGGAPVDYAYGADLTLGNSADEIFLMQMDHMVHSVAYGDFTTQPLTVMTVINKTPDTGQAMGMAENYYNGPTAYWIDQVSFYGTENNHGTPGAENDGVDVGAGADSTPPGLIDAWFSRSDRIVLVFDDLLNTPSVETPTNYSMNNAVGSPTEAERTSPLKVELRFPAPLTPEVEYTLTISGIADQFGNALTAPIVTTLQFAKPSLTISEVMYNPPAGDAYEFIELYNTSLDTPVTLNGETFTEGIFYTFPPDTVIPPGGYLVVTRSMSLATFKTYYGLGLDVTVLGPFDGALSNGGETVELRSAAVGGVEILTFEYDDARGWPLAADGGGHSLVPLNKESQPRGWSGYPGNWRASAYMDGSPGQADPEPPIDVLLNEITAHTDVVDPVDPVYDSNDWIELYNGSANSVALSGYYLSDDIANLQKWAIPVGTNIAGKSWLSFDEMNDFHSPITTGFGISKDGESIFLTRIVGDAQDRIVDAVELRGQENGVSLSRYPDGIGYWGQAPRTRDTANAAWNLDLTLNEVMYHPVPSVSNPEDNTSDEYIELVNPTAMPISLWTEAGPWRLNGGVDYDFPANTIIPAGGVALVVNFYTTDTAQLTAFKTLYGITDPAVQILGPYSGNLSNSGERIAVERPQAPDAIGDPVSWVIVDELYYYDQAPFPIEPDAQGASLHRTAPGTNGWAPTSWSAGQPNPGVAEFAPIRARRSGWLVF